MHDAMVLSAPWCEQHDTITKPLGVTKQRAISCKNLSFVACRLSLATAVRYLLPSGFGYRLHVGCTKAMCGVSQVFCSMGLNQGVWPWNRLRSVPMYLGELGVRSEELGVVELLSCLVVESFSSLRSCLLVESLICSLRSR